MIDAFIYAFFNTFLIYALACVIRCVFLWRFYWGIVDKCYHGTPDSEEGFEEMKRLVGKLDSVRITTIIANPMRSFESYYPKEFIEEVNSLKGEQK